MVVESITHSDLSEKFTTLKQDRFSGQLLLSNSSGQEWNFYLFMGRVLYATGGMHAVRRWQRNVAFHCPKVELNQQKLSSLLATASTEVANISWEYQLLYIWLEQRQLNREEAGKIIGAIVAEVLFDVTQAQQIAFQLRAENITVPQLVLLDPGQMTAEIQQAWHAWQKAKLGDRSPNYAPVIKHPEQLQQQVSAAVYQNLTKLLDGQRTLRDIALGMKRDVMAIACSLLPYFQSGLVELIATPDFAPPIAPVSSISSPQGPLIACVDDSPLVCQSMESILTSAGYRFLAVQDSLRAIATLLTRKPSLIFLDLVMPNTNGYEICSQLRKVSVFRNTPIIILTGNDGIIDRVRAKFVGASDFLSKPVDAEAVLEATHLHLNTNVLEANSNIGG